MSSLQSLIDRAMGLVSGYVSQLLGLTFSFAMIGGLMFLGFASTLAWIRGNNGVVSA